MKKLNDIVAVAILTASGATLAHAAIAPTRSETVHFADLNTNSLEGAAALYSRIEKAAHRVCEYPESGPQVGVSRLDVRCLHQAISDAIIKVGRATVTAYAAGREGEAGTRFATPR